MCLLPFRVVNGEMFCLYEISRSRISQHFSKFLRIGICSPDFFFIYSTGLPVLQKKDVTAFLSFSEFEFDLQKKKINKYFSMVLFPLFREYLLSMQALIKQNYFFTLNRFCYYVKKISIS